MKEQSSRAWLLSQMEAVANGFEQKLLSLQLDSCLRLLALQKQLIGYNQLGKILQIAPGKNRFIKLLEDRSLTDKLAKQPFFCSLIVNKESGMSSDGFFKHLEALSVQVDNRREFWETQRDQCFAFFD